MKNITKNFDEYEHSIAIIYSALENQYDYALLNCNDDCKILCTQFDFNYIGGSIPKDYKDILRAIKEYIRKNNKKEFILFSPNDKWDDILRQTFQKIKGVIDSRSIFRLDLAKFTNIYDHHKFKYQVDIIEEKENNSKTMYKVAVIKENNNVLAFCKGFMTGKKNVELDVHTENDNRRRGMAFEVALKMIKNLIEEGKTPNWTCWSEKVSSSKLANKLGFTLVSQLNAYIWVDEFSEIS